MKIDHAIACGGCGDIQRVRIAPLLHAVDVQASEFLSIYLFEESASNIIARVPQIKMTIAIATFEHGETLKSASQKIRMNGWRFGTLADWYRYLENGGVSKSGHILLPGEIYRDEEFNEWYPRVTSYPHTVGGKIARTIFSVVAQKKNVHHSAVADISMKRLRLYAPFKTEAKFLVTRLEQEKLT